MHTGLRHIGRRSALSALSPSAFRQDLCTPVYQHSNLVPLTQWHLLLSPSLWPLPIAHIKPPHSFESSFLFKMSFSVNLGHRQEKKNMSPPDGNMPREERRHPSRPVPFTVLFPGMGWLTIKSPLQADARKKRWRWKSIGMVGRG